MLFLLFYRDFAESSTQNSFKTPILLLFLEFFPE